MAKARALNLICLVLTLICFLVAVTHDAWAASYHLSFSGDPGTTFAGHCTIGDGRDEATFALTGGVPGQRVVTSDFLDCRLEASGPMILDIRHDQNHTRTATDGGMIHLELSAGPKRRTPH